MGLIVSSKSMLRAICDDSNMALGLSIIISSFSAGLIIGPSLAGEFLILVLLEFVNKLIIISSQTVIK